MNNKPVEDAEYWKKKYYDYVEYIDKHLDRLLATLSEIRKSQEKTREELNNLMKKLGMNIDNE